MIRRLDARPGIKAYGPSDAPGKMETDHDNPRHPPCQHESRGCRMGRFRGPGGVLSDLRDSGTLLADVGVWPRVGRAVCGCPGGSFASPAEGIVGSIVSAWLIASVFMGVYNRLISRAHN